MNGLPIRRHARPVEENRELCVIVLDSTMDIGRHAEVAVLEPARYRDRIHDWWNRQRPLIGAEG